MSATRLPPGVRRQTDQAPIRTGGPPTRRPATPVRHSVRVDARFPGDDVFEFGSSFAVAPPRPRPPKPAPAPRTGGFGALPMFIAAIAFAASGFAAGTLAQAAVGIGNDAGPDLPVSVPVDRTITY